MTQTVHPDGTFGYRLFMGPQEYARLSSLGEDMEEVNPYGWRFIRPVVRPLVSVITDNPGVPARPAEPEPTAGCW